MKIVSWNVNGIRSCINKNFWDWFDKEDADIVCLQETRITSADFEKIARDHSLTPYKIPKNQELFPDHKPLSKRKHEIFYALAAAEKPGYSGVAVFAKKKPLEIEIGLGDKEYDREGRVIFAHYEDFTLVTTYIPNGGRDLSRVPYKLEYSDLLLQKLQKLRKTQKNIAICGDMNVAHQEIDIKNPKTNVNNSGFTPIEREWFTKFLKADYVDTFRYLNPDARDVYSWWSNRPGVRERNVGWRIDYFVVTKEMMKYVKKAGIDCHVKGSDHCPVTLDVSF